MSLRDADPMSPRQPRDALWRAKISPDVEVALACLRRAVDQAPSPDALGALAIGYRNAGLHEAAARTWERARDADPGSPTLRRRVAEAWTDAGTARKLEAEETHERADRVRGSYLEEVLAIYKRALRNDPSHPLASYNIGVMYAQIGRLSTAKRWFTRALQDDPDVADIHMGLGTVARQRGALRRAVRWYEQALALDPSNHAARRALSEVMSEIGNQEKAQGRLRRSLVWYERALFHDARSALVWYNFGVALAEAGRRRRAKTCYEMAVLLDPEFAEAHNNLGVALNDGGDAARTLACYQRAVAINPCYAEAFNNMGGLYAAGGRYVEARAALERAIELRPGYVAAWNCLGVVAQEQGEFEEAARCHERALALDPGCRAAQHNSLMLINYRTGLAPSRAYEEHAAWGRVFQAQSPPLPPIERRAPARGRPLHVGYLSPDFSAHSVGYFLEGLIKHHSRDVAVIGYANMDREDPKTAVFKEHMRAWRPIYGKPAEEVARMIRQDGIDLLVDLAGHTSNNRLDVMALRAAPVQLTYLGYPNTTGLPSIDYRITDAIADPKGAEGLHTERLLRVPGCFLCYTPPRGAPPVAPLPCLTRGGVTFVSFNNGLKLNDHVLSVWSRVLRAVPGARLLLKNKSASSPEGRQSLFARIERAGIDLDRVDWLPLLRATNEHLSAYSSADLSLDTFPYAGTTTTCEALFMGVPVVTLTGPLHAHNVGASLLTAAGLPELVARSEDAYVEIACRLASDPRRLASLRRSLRERLLASALCDGRAFTQRLEGLYHEVFDAHLRAIEGDGDGAFEAA